VRCAGFLGKWGGGERERCCKGGEKNLLPLPAARPGEENGKQCHRNGTIHLSFFYNSE